MVQYSSCAVTKYHVLSPNTQSHCAVTNHKVWPPIIRCEALFIVCSVQSLICLVIECLCLSRSDCDSYVVMSHTLQPLHCTQAVQRLHMVITHHKDRQWLHQMNGDCQLKLSTAQDDQWSHRLGWYSHRMRLLNTQGHFTWEACWPHTVSNGCTGQMGVHTGPIPHSKFTAPYLAVWCGHRL